ncbi:MAG: bifunctional DNA primase/polymerase [Chloroflexota bacterium]
MYRDLNAVSAPTHEAPTTNQERNRGKETNNPVAGDYITGRNIAKAHFSPLELALSLAAQGFAVLPCREKDGRSYQNKKGQTITPPAKSPYWHKDDLPNGKDNATTDPEQIKAWWARWPEALAGIACAPSGLVVVDIDRHTCDGFATWQSLVAARGVPPQGPAQSTRGGGLHLVFRRPANIKVRGRTAALGPGVDLLVNGYFCSGAGYAWQAGCDFTASLPDLPAWIAELTNQFEKSYYVPREHSARPKGNGTRPGDEYARSHSWQEILGPHGWTLVGSKGEVDYWRRPGKEHGISATTGYNGQDTFFCFTTNGQPFESWQGYKKFTAYTLLEHGGDFQAAARAAMLACASPAIPIEAQSASAAPEPETPDSIPEELAGEWMAISEKLSKHLPPYILYRRAIHAVERLRDGTDYFKRLCHFAAKIDKEILRDDGQVSTRELIISGRHENGRRFPPARINAEDFVAMGWVMKEWGPCAIVCAGSSTKDKLREAIQQLSDDIDSQTIYTHTGWREVDGKRVFLTTAGAVGLPGVPVTVELPDKLRHYAIPTSLEGVDLCEAVRASLRLLDLAPKTVTYPIYAAMFLAPLAELAPIDFVLWVHGETGSLKSSLVAQFLNHYGEGFAYEHMPDGWNSTWMLLERRAFLLKDVPFVIDDYCPQASHQETKELHKSASKLIRNIGNQTPRNRLDADTSERTGFPARGLVIATAELLPPGGESNTGRTFMVKMRKIGKDDQQRPELDIDMLTETQQTGYKQLLGYAMSGYLAWLAGRWEDLRAEYRQRFTEIRTRMRVKAVHLRHAATTARLLLALKLVLTFAHECGALTLEEANARYAEAEAAMLQLAATQDENIREERPTLHFMNALAALLQQGDYYLARNENDIRSDAKWLGWVTEKYVYLFSDVAYHAVVTFYRAEGDHFKLPKRELYEMLVLDRYVHPGKERTTTPADFGGKNYRVLRVYRERMEW